MSFSTTTTATYELAKYSRAYGHAANNHTDQTDLQWQHFVNPVIKLTMDTRKSSDGSLESYRLRILWTFSAGLDSMDVDQCEVVFEDLDLVTYSSMPSLQAPQGMPLKAVFQDNVVGLRYQHPRAPPPGAAPQYRRFQVAFQTAAAASAFIESIRFICPCKANAPPPARAGRAAANQNRPSGLIPSLQVPNISANSRVHPSVHQQTTLRPAASATFSEDEPPLPAIRRTGTTLPPFSSLDAAAPRWDHSQSLYATQPPPTQHAPEAYLSNPVNVARSHGEHADAASSSRPSSAVSFSSAAAQHSSSDPPPGGPITHAPATASASTEALQRAAGTRPLSERHQSLSLVAPALLPSGSSDTSLPSSSFPHSSSSPPRHPGVLPSSPDLMPPPPVPRTAPRSSAPTPAASASTSTRAAQAAATTAACDAVPTVTIASEASAAVSDPLGGANPSGAAAPLGRDVVTAALRDSAGVYDLPKEELEKLVAEVIREDGFADLMAALDGMWRVKGLVGIA